MLRNVRVYYAMSEVKVDFYEINPNAIMLDKDKFWTKCAEQFSACTEDEDEDEDKEPIQNIKDPLITYQNK